MAGASSKARRPATYADLEALPEHLRGEIIGGELVVQPRPAPEDVSAASGLGYVLGGPFRYGVGGPGGWWILDEPELHLGGDVLVSDLAGWRVERMSDLPETASFSLAPDWICEVLSPSSERVDRVEKLDAYARERVSHVWLLNPVIRVLEVYRLEGDRWLRLATHGEADAPARIEPFDAVPIDLRLLWSRPVSRG